ncbi:MAG: hypothetical protein CMQ35_09035 [Gammaproteobacteria bacterium]|nr:hypothetical protein [Gammaproteobacteria bacterium]
MGNFLQELKRRKIYRIAPLYTTVALVAGLLMGGVMAQPASEYRSLVDQYCVTCHNQAIIDSPPEQADALTSQLRAVGLALDNLDLSTVGTDGLHWEKVVRKLQAGLMPPAGMPRPEQATLDSFRNWLTSELDSAAAVHPEPGRPATIHRLNRAEYHNAIRDLLALDINVDDFLPADDAGYGFDNIGGVLRMSQALLERYLDAGRTISRLAVGNPPSTTFSETYRTEQDEQQHERATGMPFGTRGGMLVPYLFPVNADYDLRVQLGGTRGLRDEYQLEVTIDGEPLELINVESGSPIELRVPIEAGPRDIGVAFYRNPPVLIEQVRQRFQNPRTAGNTGGPGGRIPFVNSLTIAGPYNSLGPGSTPSRDKIFTCQPTVASQEATCARALLSDLTRQAYRRPVTDEDVNVILEFYDRGRADGGSFENGIELAIRRLLVSPEFLVRIEADPISVAPNTAYKITDVELASRLSFFLWSSIPDDELLVLAERGTLSLPSVLGQQVRRMLADPRSKALTKNFAGQWLQLRNLETLVRPGEPYAVAFDETLRQAMITETEMFFDSLLQEDRGVLELLTADYTYLNSRLAGHYDIPNIQGSHFRRVVLPANSPRRGLLGQGSILTLTSHAIRTSPVLRGKWILDNILGNPPPDPPPNVPALDDSKTQAKVATMRERMAAHRENPVCAACHVVIDPAGFALENFDAIGRYREVDESFNPIDAFGELPDGTKFNGVTELRAALVEEPSRFVSTFTEKLLTYALGRGVDHYDMPEIRRILQESATDRYAMQSIVIGIVNSYPFLYRRSGS